MLNKLVISLLFAVTATAKVRFDNHQVIRLWPEEDHQLKYLHQLYQNSEGLDFWTIPRKLSDFVDVRVPPQLLEDFHKNVGKLNMKNDTLGIEKAEEELVKSRSSNSRLDWHSYYDLDVIYDWMKEIANTYPDIVELYEGGTTYEERTILGVKLSYKPNNPVVFIESGIHAREWVCPATTTCILNELLTSEDPDIRLIAENFDWHIFPIVNPDGYKYSFDYNRMWRKTRTPGDRCYGVDGNRNWDDRWLEEGGASSNECSETYAGTEPFSTVEYDTLAKTITSSDPTVYFCMHSYSQLLMIPFGHTLEVADNHDELMEIGTKAIASLAERYGTQYKVGPIYDVIYTATGGSMDWVKSYLKVPYTFEWELRDTGYYGFLLPTNQILPTCLETLDSMKTILLEVYNSISKK
ncbi:hypothetical protein L9F63_016089 [Diploptera punctata]|uniref:Peptidase M14 domain-containing protein n=1 Tax=Diploptera punctata TaxID=6984 RepID=A0AAD8A1N5_DIPPU|nr:hypothetical protein L9F63_016089 [Diploptera punctata]